MTIIVIILVIGLFIFVVVNSGKKEEIRKPNPNSPTTSELLLRTEFRIQESKKLLDEIKTKYPKAPQKFGNENEYEVTGVHIPNRKKYILENCSENDEVEIFHEKKNTYSEKAIAIKHFNKIIGYISQYENEEVHEIIEDNYEGKISEIEFENGYLTVKIIIEY